MHNILLLSSSLLILYLPLGLCTLKGAAGRSKYGLAALAIKEWLENDNELCIMIIDSLAGA